MSCVSWAVTKNRILNNLDAGHLLRLKVKKGERVGGGAGCRITVLNSGSLFTCVI